jgi:hypothetical protein
LRSKDKTLIFTLTFITMPFNKKGNRARNVDAESGKRRVTSGKKSRAPPPSDSESEEVFEDSDLESDLEMPRKDTSVRKSKGKASQKPKTVASHGIDDDEDVGDDLAKEKKTETSSSVAPHMSFLLAMTYHIGLNSIIRPEISVFVPDCTNYFKIVFAMASAISENTYLHEMCPGYFSLSLYVYCGYLYYYQILRAKDYVGMNQLTRLERRALRKLETYGKPESWPVPSPLIEFIRGFGAYKSVNNTYSWVVPRFPDFSPLTSGADAGQGLRNMHTIAGIMRVPLMPALIQFLRNIGNNSAGYTLNDGWLPVKRSDRTHTNTRLSTTRPFIGMTDSTATGSAFQAMSFSGGWLLPTEGEMNVGSPHIQVKQNIIRRMAIPDATRNFADLETFLLLDDAVNSSFIRQLIGMMSIVNRFFPGSTNMSNIDPVSHLGFMAETSVSYETPRTATEHVWIHEQGEPKIVVRGYDDSEAGRLLSRIGMATAPVTRYTATYAPVAKAEALRAGPFFVDDNTAGTADYERHEMFRTETTHQGAVTARAEEQISALYDPTGKHSG